MPNLIEISSGLRVRMPAGIAVNERREPAPGGTAARPRRLSSRTPGVVPLPPGGTGVAAASDPVAAALKEQDLVLVGSILIAPAPGTTRVRAAAPGDQMEVEVDLGPQENAIALLEQDGFYSWHFKATETVPAGRARGPGARARTAVFRLPLDGTQGAAKRGILTDLITGQAQAFIFKFAGRFLLGRGAAFLERKVRMGLVVLGQDNPADWEDLPDFSALELPEDRPARILLFVHGTFSSTRGGFGGLGATPWGRAFLAAARANYDVVVGFDHPTLSVDPLTNATELLRSLETREWKQPALIDAISHSRGGITLRSLIEQLLPAASLPIRVERAVFVGAVNGGTELAEPKNWESFINLYTNLAAGACKAIALFPQTAFAGALMAEMLKSVGVLVKVLAEEAITGKAVPGLAAMQPNGPFLLELNKTQPGQLAVEQSRFYAITSEFRARLALESLSELPRKMLLALADGAMDQLMGKANDLVVNTDSMTHIDPQAGTFIKDTLAFGENGTVYHTNYFLQPQAVNALARWFELALPQVASPARSRGTRRAGALPVEVPARIDTDVLVAPAEDTTGETLERIRKQSPAYVVVDRMLEEGLRHYAFQTEEVIEAATGAEQETLVDALNLHETDASSEGPVDELRQPDASAEVPSLRRAVAMHGTRVLGVMEPAITPTPIGELVREAQRVSAPQSTEDQVMARRLMPSLAKPAVEPAFASPLVRRGIGPPRSRAPVKKGGAGGGGHVLRQEGGQPPLPLPTETAESDDDKESPSLVDCHVLAEMDGEIEVDQPTSVEVTLSRDAIEAVRTASAGAGVIVEAAKKIAIELIPRKNIVALSETRIEVDVPAPGKPAVYGFDVKGTDPGEGEIVLRIRQDIAVLATLPLHCQIVAPGKRRSTLPAKKQAQLASPPANLPRHQLTIMEIERGGQKFYRYILESPSLNLCESHESRPLNGSRNEFIKGVFEDIENRYLSHKDDYDEFQKELQDVGGDLWGELFPEKIQAALWRCRDQIDNILVFSEEPFIPWELVHLKEPGKGVNYQETRFFGQMGLVRWLRNMGWPTEDLRARPGRCHFVIPKYPHPDYRLPGAEAEEPFLRDKFKATPVDPRPKPVRTILETGGFDLLHFACHGVADSQNIARAELLLEGRIEGQNYVTEKLRATTIENLNHLVGTDGVRPIVTLNACQAARAGYKMTSIGGFSQAFLGRGAGMFIAALWSVGDLPARTFTEKLYQELLDGKTLAEASIAGREASRAAQEATWLAYTVYGNPHARLTT